MDLLQAITLGFIQGVTEWLPISSTGHLKIAEGLIGLASLPLLFDVILHIGTLTIILVFFRQDIKLILAALLKGDFTSENGKLIPLIIIGTLPTAFIGVIFNRPIETYFSDFLPIAGAFLVCGVVIFISKTGTERKENISYVVAIAMGTVQGIALVPGLSRSGLTIAMGLMLGVERQKTFKFSFLLSVPAVIGALGLTLYDQHAMLAVAGIEWTEILAGISMSILVGYLALKFLWKVLSSRKFYLFAFYCWLFGAALLALTLSL
jgi:undecaprenyl-diphosphatase